MLGLIRHCRFLHILAAILFLYVLASVRTMAQEAEGIDEDDKVLFKATGEYVYTIG